MIVLDDLVLEIVQHHGDWIPAQEVHRRSSMNSDGSGHRPTLSQVYEMLRHLERLGQVQSRRTGWRTQWRALWKEAR